MGGTKTLLQEIEAFLKEASLAPTRFGQKSARDNHLVFRLRAGGGITLAKADKVRRFMRDWRKRAARAKPPSSRAVARVS